MNMIEQSYSLGTFLYFDIETVPCQDDAYLEVLREKVSAPANYKKAESIEKWLDENRDTVAAENMHKTGFDGGRGHVCTIAWAANNGDIHGAHAKDLSQERAVIEMFFDQFDQHSVTIVGHNISGFDIGFLRKRAIVLGIPMPRKQSFPRDPKPWTVADTMSMWEGGTGRISLDNLCDILGLEGKDGFDGSMVAEAWASGEHDKIVDYCKGDVSKIRQIHQKMLLAGY